MEKNYGLNLANALFLAFLGILLTAALGIVEDRVMGAYGSDPVLLFIGAVVNGLIFWRWTRDELSWPGRTLYLAFSLLFTAWAASWCQVSGVGDIEATQAVTFRQAIAITSACLVGGMIIMMIAGRIWPRKVLK